MDIKRMKYNQELIKNKIRLEKELKMVEQEITALQAKCDHIRIGLDNQFYCCLFCLKENPRSLYNVIDTRRVESFNSTRVSEIDRDVILYEIQKLAINKLLEVPSISAEELIRYLNETIKSEKNKQKVHKMI